MACSVGEEGVGGDLTHAGLHPGENANNSVPIFLHYKYKECTKSMITLYSYNKQMKLYFQTRINKFQLEVTDRSLLLPPASQCQASFTLMRHDFAKQISG